MKFLSVCSGIEAASVAWNPLGWKAAAFAEIEKFPSAVLAHHYPGVPNLGDMTKFQEWPDLGSVDLLCGGTPCQSFSVAGLRKGLDDPRGNLMLTFGAIAAKHRPRWLVWENVPGVLSSNGGRDFGAFLGLLGVLGYGFAYRVLDAQYAGLAQRRKRVFVVGCLGDWRSAAAVLFERHSLQGHPAPSRETWQGTTGCVTTRLANSSGQDLGAGFAIPERARALTTSNQRIDAETETFVIQAGATRENPDSGPDGVGISRGPAYTLEARSEVQYVAHSLTGEGCFDASENGTGRGTPLVPIAFDDQRGRDNGGFGYDQARTLHSAKGQSEVQLVAFSCKDHGADASDDLAPTLRAMGHSGSHPNAGGQMAVAFGWQNSAAQGASASDQHTPTLDKSKTPAVGIGMAVRRLTPRECEALQGFPRDYTLIPYRGKPAADGPRYKALGNSWAVPCARWIGERIDAVEAVLAAQKVAA